MKLKINNDIVNLPDDSTIRDLLESIGHDVSGIKAGFPPKTLALDDVTVKLADVGLRSGDKLIVETLRAINEQDQTTVNSSQLFGSNVSSTSNIEASDPKSSKNQLNQARRLPQSRFSVPVGDLGHLNLRIMEDDNSCLFRALGYTILNNKDSVTELRSIVADTVRQNPGDYEPLLEVALEKYPEWIMKSTTWGGAVEMDILARHFDVSISSLDVTSSRIDTFNGDAKNFVMVVYSGIHYDAVALNPLTSEDFSTLEMDQTVFLRSEEHQKDLVLGALKSLGQKLVQDHYYTDTATFTIKCNVCKARFKGEKEAVKHANATGHADFREE